MPTTSVLDSNVKLLGRLPLFADVPKDDLILLAGQTRVDSYEREAVIFFQGDICERIYLVRSGRVKIVYHDEDGREVILEIISPGEAFGGGVLFSPCTRLRQKRWKMQPVPAFPARSTRSSCSATPTSR